MTRPRVPRRVVVAVALATVGLCIVVFGAVAVRGAMLDRSDTASGPTGGLRRSDTSTSAATSAPDVNPPPTPPPTTTTPTTTTPTTTTTPPPPAPSSSAPTAAPAPAPGGALAGAVIVVDPGHNGANGSHGSEINRQVDAGGFRKACNTTGTAGGDYSEARFNWETAQLLVAELRARGATVITTRDSNDGWGPCVDERGLTAARAHAALLISIHADGSSAGNHGFHVISPTRVSGYTKASVEPSRRLATHVRDALVGAGFSPSNYIGSGGLDQRGDLGTLNRAGVPAVIVECGNMRNAADLAQLRSPDAQSRLARAFADAAAVFVDAG